MQLLIWANQSNFIQAFGNEIWCLTLNIMNYSHLPISNPTTCSSIIPKSFSITTTYIVVICDYYMQTCLSLVLLTQTTTATQTYFCYMYVFQCLRYLTYACVYSLETTMAHFLCLNRMVVFWCNHTNEGDDVS